MSVDEFDAIQEEAWEEFLDQIGSEAIDAYRLERLGAYYEENPRVAIPAVKALEEARKLQHAHPAAALVFAVIAIDVGFKNVLVGPIVYGMVHMEAAAGLIVNIVIQHRALDRFKEILEHIFKDETIVEKRHSIDLLSYKRQDSNKSLWEEIKIIQSIRNNVVHKGDDVTSEEASMAIEVATVFLYDLLKTVVNDLGCQIELDTE